MSNFFIFALLAVALMVCFAYYNLLGNFIKLLNLYDDPESSHHKREQILEIAGRGMEAALLYQFAMVITIPVGAGIFLMTDPTIGRWIALFIFPVYLGQAIPIFGTFPSVDWAKEKAKKIKLYNISRSACLVNAALLVIITAFAAVNRLNIF